MSVATQAVPAVNPNNPFDVVLAELANHLQDCPARIFAGPQQDLVQNALGRKTMYSQAILNRIHAGLMYALDFRGDQFGLEVLGRGMMEGERILVIRVVQ